MANNYIDFLKGLNLVPNGSTLNSEQGDLEVTGGQLKFHDGTANRAVVVDVFTGNVDITGILTVTGQANVDNLRLDGNTLSSTDVDGDITLAPNGTGNVSLTIAAGGVVQLGSASVTVDDAGIVTITGQLNVDNLRLDGNTISSTDTDGDITLDPDGNGSVVLSVSGSGLVELGSGNISADSTGILSVVGEASIDNIKIDGNVISSTDTDGPITLTPDGVGIVEASSSVSVQGDVTIKDGNSLILADADSSNSVELKSPAAITVDYSITLPDAQGAAGEVMVNDGSGNLSWGANGAGDVVGPVSSTDEAIVRFDGTTGKLLQNSSVTISDAGIVSGATQLNVDNLRLDGNVISSTDTNGNVTVTPNGTGITEISSSLQINAQNELRLADSDSSNHVAIKSAATVATNYSLTLPAAQGAAGETLQNDGSGNLSWAAGGGGSTPVTFTIANNQVAAANVTGFLLNSATNKQFTSEVSITRRTSTPANGTEDAAFYANLGTGFDNQVLTAAWQADGKLIVGGSFTLLNGDTRNGVVRLNSDGTEDTSFYTNLGVITSVGTNAAAVQSDGKVLLGGILTLFGVGGSSKITRVNSDGTRDATFNGNLAVGSFNGSVNAIGIQSDGKIVLGGQFTQYGTNFRDNIVRLNADGTEDTTFYTNVGGITGSGPYVSAIKIQSDDKIIVCGSFDTVNGVGSQGGIARLNADGTPDTTFRTNVGTAAGSSYTEDATILSDGRIVVVGQFSTFSGNTRYDVVCLNSSGTEDTAFYTNLGTGFSAGGNLTSVAALSDDKIIISGTFTAFDGNTRDRLVWLNDDGTEASAFYTNSGGLDNYAEALAVKANDAVFLGGLFTTLDGNTRNRAALLGPEQSELMENFTLRGIYSPMNTSWSLNQLGFGVDAGVTLTMTSGGQLQYTSTNMSGTSVESTMKFLITGL